MSTSGIIPGFTITKRLTENFILGVRSKKKKNVSETIAILEVKLNTF